MAKNVRVMRRVAAPAKRAQALKGATLFQPVAAGSQYERDVSQAFDAMRKEVEREVIKTYQLSTSAVVDTSQGATLDGLSLVTAMNKLMKKLTSRFTLQFNVLADHATKRMVDRTVDNSNTSIRSSLKDIAPELTIKLDDIPAAMKETIAAGSHQAAAMIKRVPQKYLEGIAGDVMRSITSGQGLADLQPAMEEHGVTVKNWARNVAMDQTRKVYNTVNRERMTSLGIKRFEWVHSGGSNQPRPYHLYELNGETFDIDNPPIIDKNTGERGFPGQLPYCRCTMRPVIEF